MKVKVIAVMLAVMSLVAACGSGGPSKYDRQLAACKAIHSERLRVDCLNMIWDKLPKDERR